MGLIRNADDFGKSREVNRAITECFAKGYIDRTTLMVNMDAAEEAVQIAKREGFADRVGIHLNLTEGTPLTEPIRSNPLLCDANGNYHAAFRQTTKYRLYMDQLSKDEIYTELDAQLARYADWGLTLFHVDSHHHVHTDYPVYCVLKQLAKKYSFSSIRISRNLYHGGSALNGLYKGWYNKAVRRLCETTSDYFGSYPDLTDYQTERQNTLLVQNRAVEIMMHPMYDAAGNLADTDLDMEQEAAFLDRIRLETT